MTSTTHDFIAIGLGPFNLGLACLTEPIEELNGVFLEKKGGFNWHPGMLMEDTTLQIPFMADLVTMADPTSRFSFLNYIKEQGRMYNFYIRENFLLLRNEYNRYCQWAIERLSSIRFNKHVHEVSYDEGSGMYLVRALCTETGETVGYRAPRLVLGTGTSPDVPACCGDLMGRAIHTASYLSYKRRLQAGRSITVVGSGQSAAEVFYDLLQDIDAHDYTLNWVTRSPRFFPLEYAKLTLEMTSPDYVDYFHGLPAAKRDALMAEQKGLYKGINQNLINSIYDTLYTKSLAGPVNVNLRTNSTLYEAGVDEETGGISLAFRQHEQERCYKVETEHVVMATGYRYRMPEFIGGIKDRIRWDEKGRYDVSRNYAIDRGASEIFVQNAELHTHGFVTPDLGMACYRNSVLIKEMMGREYYPIEKRIAFQQFGVGQEEEVMPQDISMNGKQAGQLA
ncbi:lysine N(6)-hydroxylase/L-ornithine N(5)-oxygenase family protein [Roseivirga sp. BDSF3-8]|uniref:lysine N(6)-hydroxylase/L-ornithine N(5)-oxygenase family protein n=1 Tax=Roseivirga sp. BDSF3-8 TaxID=3241598 RepID=UPI003531A18C